MNTNIVIENPSDENENVRFNEMETHPLNFVSQPVVEELQLLNEEHVVLVPNIVDSLIDVRREIYLNQIEDLELILFMQEGQELFYIMIFITIKQLE